MADFYPNGRPLVAVYIQDAKQFMLFAIIVVKNSRSLMSTVGPKKLHDKVGPGHVNPPGYQAGVEEALEGHKDGGFNKEKGLSQN